MTKRTICARRILLSSSTPYTRPYRGGVYNYAKRSCCNCWDLLHAYLYKRPRMAVRQTLQLYGLASCMSENMPQHAFWRKTITERKSSLDIPSKLLHDETLVREFNDVIIFVLSLFVVIESICLFSCHPRMPTGCLCEVPGSAPLHWHPTVLS